MTKKLLGEIELNRIYQRDCIEGMRMIPDGSVDIAVTSPPYNIGKCYEKRTPIEEYSDWSRQYFTEVYRVLRPNRSFLLQVGQYIDHATNNIPLPYILYPILISVGFKLRQEIVWRVRGGMQAKRKLTGQHEKVLWLYKGDCLPDFFLDDIRVKEWAAIDSRNNPNGKNPTDVWDFNRVAGNSAEKTEHPCQFPQEMIRRIIRGWSQHGDIVLDPFMGSGTTAVAATLEGRNFIGFETAPEYIEIANKRLDSIPLFIPEVAEPGEE